MKTEYGAIGLANLRKNRKCILYRVDLYYGGSNYARVETRSSKRKD